MARTTNEVLIGPGTLYVAALGTAFPIDPTVAPAGSWLEIGYSEAGWAAAVDRTFETIMAAEEYDPLFILKTAQEIHIRGTLMQASLEIIQYAIGGLISTAVGPPATKSLAFPLATEMPTEYALLFRAKAPTVAGVAKVRDWKITRAMSQGGIEVPHNKAPNVSTVAIDWTALKPAAGNTCTVTDTT